MQLAGAKILHLDKLKNKKDSHCVFCNSSVKLHFFKEKTVCLTCLNHIQELNFKGYFTK